MMKDEKSQRNRLCVSLLITAASLILAVAHAAFPKITFDAVTVSLVIIAVLPWLGAVFRKIELPGGVKIEYQELVHAKQEAENAGLLARPDAAAERPAFLAVAESDPNLALVGLRIEIEKRLRTVAEARGIDASRQSIGPLLRRLSAEDVLSQQESSVLADMIGLLNNAAHGALVDPRAGMWALDIAPQLLVRLEQLARPREE